MFTGLMAQVREAVGSLLGRLAVGVLFLVAATFAVTATTLALIDLYGAQAAYWLLAFGFAVLGCILAIILSVQEEEKVAAEAQSEAVAATSGGGLLDPQNALAALTAIAPILLTPSTMLSMAMRSGRFALRNLPLIIVLVLVLILLWPFERRAEATPYAAPTPGPPDPAI